MPDFPAKFVVFGTSVGIEQILRILPHYKIALIVAPSIRPSEVDAVQTMGKENGIPFMIQPKFGTPEYEIFYSRLAAISFEFIVSNCYSMIIRDDVLSL